MEIVDDLQRIHGLDYNWREYLPRHPVVITVSYDNDGAAVTKEVNLYDAFHLDTNDPLLDVKYYLQNMMHTEEEQVVHEGTTLLSNPEIFYVTSDPVHIEFDLTKASARTHKKTNPQVNKHLQVRGYTNLHSIQEDRHMDAEGRRNFLKDRLALCRKILQIQNAPQNEEMVVLKKRCIQISQLVICILHLENRTSESVITQFVKVALDLVQNRADMKKTIGTYMNTTVFGKTESAG